MVSGGGLMKRVVLSECSSTWKQKGRVSGNWPANRGGLSPGVPMLFGGKLK